MRALDTPAKQFFAFLESGRRLRRQRQGSHFLDLSYVFAVTDMDMENRNRLRAYYKEQSMTAIEEQLHARDLRALEEQAKKNHSFRTKKDRKRHTQALMGVLKRV